MLPALLLIDIQNDYFPGGKNELVGSLEASLKARRLLDAFRRRNYPVIHVQHVSIRPGATYLLPGTPGIGIHENVKPDTGEAIVQKHYPNSFRDTGLLETLRGSGATRLVIGGMMTHMCVDSTVRAAYDHGFECIVAGDACATKDLVLDDKRVRAEEAHAAFLIAMNGVFGRVLTVEQVLGLL